MVLGRPYRVRVIGRESHKMVFFRAATLVAFVALTCISAFPQNQTLGRIAPSELGQENMDRVAASAAQIESILHANPGLMVELKNWVAKDATDHGQLISDADLADQAIFDRLESDIQFRSVATRLMQKYGYLLPMVNPDSPQGKEQEILVQERAKWLSQDEEDIHRARLQTNSNTSREGECEPQTDPNCGSSQGNRPAGQQEASSPAPFQRTLASPPPARSVPYGSSPRPEPTLEQAELRQTSAGMPLGASRLSAGSAASSSDLGNFASQPGNGQSAKDSSGATGQGSASGAMFPPIMDSASESDWQGAPLRNSQQPLQLRPFGHMPMEPSPSQRMIRQPNPYEDIPSLYDMYLQASPHPPAPERFGMEVFENGTRDLQMIPMDLPVGPDYVVGPGDALAIDLWGGVSQRILRTVDNEGRLSLPEVGPVLVSGKSLADVQQTVQRTLRSQFRDVSADVSLSRLRTIRVPMMEGNVQEAVKNNVFGLMGLLEIADDCGCERFILISSDKAVNPTSVMGATKRVGELILGCRPANAMRCISVRFGNVLGSNGSVVPLLQQQLENNRPLTITHPEIKRYFMTPREAVALVLEASTIGDHGDILVLEMGKQISILQLARTLIQLSGKTEKQVSIQFTGLRPGEKLYEELFSEAEEITSTDRQKIKRVRGGRRDWPLLARSLEELRASLTVDGPEPVRSRLREILPEYVSPSINLTDEEQMDGHLIATAIQK